MIDGLFMKRELKEMPSMSLINVLRSGILASYRHQPYM